MMITIRAQPYDFKLDPERTALVVIDMQRDFIEPGGFGMDMRLGILAQVNKNTS